MSTPGKQLTKKQKKALAHRDKSERKTKGKGKSSVQEEPLAVPEPDTGEDLERVQLPLPESKSNKRKREDGDDVDGLGEDARASGKENEDVGEELKEGKMAKRRRKAREKKAAEAEARASRLILFAGNLPYKATKEEVEAHFEQTGPFCFPTALQRPILMLPVIRREADCATPHAKGCSRHGAKVDGKN
jgi:nucleolar protein 6